MSPTLASTGPRPDFDDLGAAKSFWPLFALMGLAMVVVGTLAISYSCLATITVLITWAFGVLLIAGGIAEIVTAFLAAPSSSATCRHRPSGRRPVRTRRGSILEAPEGARWR